MEMDIGTERALLERCQRGERRAYEPIVRGHEERLLDFLFWMTGNEEDARDLAQETFVRAWRKLASYDTSRPFRAWLFAIARNKFRDFKRARNANPVLGASRIDRVAPFPDPKPIPDDQLLLKERKERVWAALHRLRPLESEALILRDIQDFSYGQIAEILNVPEGTAASRIHNARRAFRKAWEELVPALVDTPISHSGGLQAYP